MNNFLFDTEPKIKSARGTAFNLVKGFGITSPEEIHLEGIAMTRGVLVLDAPLKGAEARLVRNGDKGIIRVNNQILEEGKRRFCIAHELGHWELHPNISQVDLYSDSNISTYWGSNEEIEANAFASELLMPSYLFRPRCQDVVPNLRNIGRLAKEFNTTLTSAIVRFVDETEFSCAVVFSENGVIKWWKRSDNGKEFWFKSKQGLHKESLAWGCQNNKDVPIEGERVDSYIWLNEENSSEINKIFEQSIKLGNYKTILSLLWID